jgi:hypothetical protein
MLGMNGLLFGAIIILTGFVIYFATGKLRARYTAELAAQPSQAD